MYIVINSTTMSFDLNKWYESINSEQAILSTKGDISSELITQTLDSVEEKLTQIKEAPRQIRKIYNVMVELLQNLYHHVNSPPWADINQRERFGIISIKKEGEVYKITTGNFVVANRVKILKDRLDQINFLSKEDLRSLYTRILDNQEFSNKGGGGLGMLDIARRTGNKLLYKFYVYNDDYYFFSLTTTV